MKLITLLIPALMMAGSMAFAQDAAPKTAKEAKKACKEKSNGDKKEFKKCIKEWKASQGK